jgi:hypothetical protein
MGQRGAADAKAMVVAKMMDLIDMFESDWMIF